MQKKMSPKMNTGTPTRIWINFFLEYSTKKKGQNITILPPFSVILPWEYKRKKLASAPRCLERSGILHLLRLQHIPASERGFRHFPSVHGTAFLPLQVALAGKMPAFASDRKSQRPTPLQSSLLVSKTAKNIVLAILTVKFPAVPKQSEPDAIHVPASVEWFPRLRLTVSSQCHRAPHFCSG